MVIDNSLTEEAQRMFATYVMDKTLLAQFLSVQDIEDGDTPIPCYVKHLVEMGVSARQRLLDLTEDSEEAEDDESDDTANIDLTRVADAGEMLRKGKFKQLTKDMHEYFTDFRVGTSGVN